LHPTSTATTIRVRDGQTLITDGPFVESKEALGGFYLITADDIDEALHGAPERRPARAGGGDLQLAEDATAEAFVAALESWGTSVPGQPGAWLATNARRKALDRVRRAYVCAVKLAELSGRWGSPAVPRPGTPSPTSGSS